MDRPLLGEFLPLFLAESLVASEGELIFLFLVWATFEKIFLTGGLRGEGCLESNQ